jgi:hypothetical protein
MLKTISPRLSNDNALVRSWSLVRGREGAGFEGGWAGEDDLAVISYFDLLVFKHFLLRLCFTI